MQKELTISDNTLFLQMLSVRDKASGLYLPSMDGNINVTLNRIYNAKNTLNRVHITLPALELIDEDSMNALHELNKNIFGSIIKFHYMKFYCSDVAITRKNVYELQELYLDRDFAQVISDFAINIIPLISNDISISYNYNWSKVSDDDNSPSAQSFDKEVELSKKFPTFLYSDVQYDYWKSKGLLGENVFRSKNIFDPQYIKIIADRYLTDTSNDSMTQEISEFINDYKQVVFYPSRIEDPRYDFPQIIEYCKWSKTPLIISNPTNVPLPKELKDMTILDLSTAEHKRASYFITLSLLRESDAIFHHESDMHISLIEQIMLTKADVIHNFDEETIKSYIKP